MVLLTKTSIPHLFMYLFKCYPTLTLEKTDLFIDMTGMGIPDDYPNNWIDLYFPTVKEKRLFAQGSNKEKL